MTAEHKGIEVRIRKKLGNFQLDVEFQADREIFAILGASGCGKSMTLRCIAGIETPDEGRIVLDGRVLFDSEKRINLPPQKRRVGYMFQDYALFPNMTVSQNIAAGMGRKPDPEQVNGYIRRFALEGLEDRLPRQLSGGQKQRTALARMLAAEPDILLLDEPLSALDAYLKWQMEEELLQILEQEKKTVLFVTHSRDEVYHLCDRVCVLSSGHMETVQPKQEFFASPQTLAAARLSGCRNFSHARQTAEHEIEASDWELPLHISGDIPADLSWVGVRAHYIEAADEPAAAAVEAVPDGQNQGSGCAVSAVLPVLRLLEQEFESELILGCGVDGKQPLRLLMDKTRAKELAGRRYVRISIPESAVMLLRD